MPKPRGVRAPAPNLKPYSVLLLYPADINDGGAETYYCFVHADSVEDAVKQVRLMAAEDNPGYCKDEELARHALASEFRPLLCIEGHHYDLIARQ